MILRKSIHGTLKFPKYSSQTCIIARSSPNNIQRQARCPLCIREKSESHLVETTELVGDGVGA